MPGFRYLPAVVALAALGQVESPIVRVTVNLVQVDAVVTDSKGRQVTDLKAEDFEITEDGRPQKITNFSYIRLASPALPAAPLPPGAVALPPAPAVTKREEVRRTIVLVVDDLGLSFESVGEVRRDLKHFVEQQFQPGDMVAIVRTSGGMGALDQFTTDLGLLLAAVERLRWYPGGRSGLSAMEPVNPGPGSGLEARSQDAQFRRVTYSLGTLGAVSYLLNGMRDMPGRKSLILISDGLRLRSILGPGESMAPRYARPSVWEPDVRIAEALRRLADQANRAAVVLYSIDARGVQPLTPTASDRLTLEDIRNQGRGDSRLTSMLLDQEGLAVLSHETGGFLVHDTNRIDFGLGQVLKDLEGYYLIGYKPDAARFQPRNGKLPDFHAIKVKVKVPKLRVRSRSGYYGYEDSPKRTDDEFSAALFSPFTSSGVHLRLTPVFAEAPDARNTITLMLHIDARDLTFASDAGDQQATADLLAFTVDERGQPIDKASYKAIIRLKPARYEYALGAGLVYTSSIAVIRPGPYQVRVAVRDTATGRIGTASQFVEVPDLKKRRLALSGLVLDSPPNQPQDREAPGVPSFRVFPRSGAFDFTCQIFNARLDPGTNKPALDTEVRVFHGQQQVLATDLKRLDIAATGSARTTAKGNVPLEAFEPGSYALQFVVHDTLAKEHEGVATQWIDFDVVQ
ncbi:MAG TPA: VWA domain-containing protein [Bryobacteraceae bacterium]|nr:VWA domain-containing protein [Bryobacteraceae bacterium]